MGADRQSMPESTPSAPSSQDCGSSCHHMSGRVDDFGSRGAWILALEGRYPDMPGPNFHQFSPISPLAAAKFSEFLPFSPSSGLLGASQTSLAVSVDVGMIDAGLGAF